MCTRAPRRDGFYHAHESRAEDLAASHVAPVGARGSDGASPSSEQPAGVFLRNTFDDVPMVGLVAPKWISTPNVEPLTVAAFKPA